MSARIAPAPPPYAPDVQATFDRLMPPGVPPLVLFTTLARDARLYERLQWKVTVPRSSRVKRSRSICSATESS